MLTQTQTRKINALVSAVAKAMAGVRANRKANGVKRTWSAHAKMEEARLLAALTEAFDNLSAYMTQDMPDHWPAKTAKFGFNVPLTQWWWQADKRTSNNPINHGMEPETFKALAGFVIALVDMATQNTKADLSRMKGLGLLPSDVNHYSLHFKRASDRRGQAPRQYNRPAPNTEAIFQSGTTPRDAIAQHILAIHAPFGRLDIRENNTKKSQYTTKGANWAQTVMAAPCDWSGAPTVLPRLFAHPAIVSAFGTLAYKPNIDSVGKRNPKDYDSLLKTCWALAEKATLEGDMKAYLLFTSPVKSYPVLARCQNGAILNHFFEQLCQQKRDSLPTSAKHIIHVTALEHP